MRTFKQNWSEIFLGALLMRPLLRIYKRYLPKIISWAPSLRMFIQNWTEFSHKRHLWKFFVQIDQKSSYECPLCEFLDVVDQKSSYERPLWEFSWAPSTRIFSQKSDKAFQGTFVNSLTSFKVALVGFLLFLELKVVP